MVGRKPYPLPKKTWESWRWENITEDCENEPDMILKF